MIVSMATLSYFTSCSNQEEAFNNNDGQIRFSTQLLKARVIGEETQNTQIATGTVGLFATTDEAGANALENGANAALTANGAGDLATSTPIYWPTSGSVYFHAYAPFQSGWTATSTNLFTVNSDQSNEANYLASDLLYGAPTANPVNRTENAVQLEFTHKLTKIIITVSSADMDLNGATVSLLNIVPSVSFTPNGGVLGSATGSATTIRMATFTGSATSHTCSAIIVPQTIIAESQFIRITTADNKNLNCSLTNNVTLNSGKAYTYNLTIGEGGVTISTSTSLSDWDNEESVDIDITEDGNGDSGDVDETYTIGDYLLADGSFVKKADFTSSQSAIGVIFSTTVSEKDAAAGYKGYVLGLETTGAANSSNRKDFAVDGQSAQVDALESPTTLMAAISHLDGLSDTEYYQDATRIANYPAFDFSAFTTEKPAGDHFSNWFLPSVGQWIQFLNNLGGAGISTTNSSIARWECYPNATANELAHERANLMLTTSPAQLSIVASLNSFGITGLINEGNRYFATSTQSGTPFWLFCTGTYANNTASVADNSGGAWSLTGTGTKYSSNKRCIIRAIAYK